MLFYHSVRILICATSVSISPPLGATTIKRPSPPIGSLCLMQISNNVLKRRSVVATVVKIVRIHQSKAVSFGHDVYPRDPGFRASTARRSSKKTYFPKGRGLKINILPLYPSSLHGAIQPTQWQGRKRFRNCQPINLINLSPRSIDPHRGRRDL